MVPAIVSLKCLFTHYEDRTYGDLKSLRRLLDSDYNPLWRIFAVIWLVLTVILKLELP